MWETIQKVIVDNTFKRGPKMTADEKKEKRKVRGNKARIEKAKKLLELTERPSKYKTERGW